MRILEPIPSPVPAEDYPWGGSARTPLRRSDLPILSGMLPFVSRKGKKIRVRVSRAGEEVRVELHAIDFAGGDRLMLELVRLEGDAFLYRCVCADIFLRMHEADIYLGGEPREALEENLRKCDEAFARWRCFVQYDISYLL